MSKNLSDDIIKYIGGVKNISNMSHCMTRLRVDLYDNEKVDLKKIQGLDKILGAQFKNNQLQIIIGPTVSTYYNEIMEKTEKNQSFSSGEKQESVANKVLNLFSGIFVPVIPAIAGAGMIKAILALLRTLNWIDTDGSTYMIINMIADAVFYFLPFLLAYSASRIFKTNSTLALVLAGVLLHPTIMNLANAGEVSEIFFLGLPLPILKYNSSVLPIILSVLLLKYVYNFVDKHMPDIMKVIFTPTVVLLIVVPIQLIVLGPLGNYFGQFLSKIIVGLFDISSAVAGFLLGATRPVFVLTGMHQAFTPIFFNNLAELGYDMLLPTFMLSTFAQSTASFMVYLQSKVQKDKAIALSATFSGFLGITEPALFGVLVRFKGAMIAAIIGGGLGSAYSSIFGFVLNTFASSSIVSMPLYAANPGFGNFVVASIITLVSTAVLTVVLTNKFDKEKLYSDEEIEGEVTNIVDEKVVENIYSIGEGELISIEEVDDPTFSTKAMGDGFAVMPSAGQIYSPIKGTVITVANTKHSVGLETDNGTEVLIHVGLDTVRLNGEHFELKVNVGDKVALGDLLIEFNKEAIEKDYNLVTPVVVMNRSFKAIKNKGVIHKNDLIGKIGV